MNNSQHGRQDQSRPDIDAAEKLAIEARKAALFARLKELTPEDFEAWKEEVRQSRLHDWDDDDEVDAATVVDDENVDGGNSSIEKHDEQ
jgi:hypothetical protein